VLYFFKIHPCERINAVMLIATNGASGVEMSGHGSACFGVNTASIARWFDRLARD
jgi:hypothetical protein